MLFDRKTIRWKLFVYYFLLFAIFTFSIILYQNKREQHFRIAQLETSMNEYTDLVNRYIESKSLIKVTDFSRLDSLKFLIPGNKVRITVIDFEGNVLYDNTISDYKHMENHKQRPEIQKALFGEFGETIRHSATTDEEYIYYAKSYNKYLVRAAEIYDIRIKAFLMVDMVFIPFFLILFLIFGFLLRYIAMHLGDSITKLKDFAVKIRRNEAVDFNDNTQFSNDELGFISREIIQLYQQLRKAKTDLGLEKEKLISHLFALKEGVAFFSAKKETILNNSHFIFYINIIAEESTISVDKIFLSKDFREVNNFIDRMIAEPGTSHLQELPRMGYSVQKDGYHFNIQCIIFPDKSFEILISDQSQQMRRSIMKQQITSNISHELKTPISSVKGYLETVINNPDLDAAKRQYFIERAFNQTERLTQLVNDIAMLNKIEEYSELYLREKVQVRSVINDVIESFSDQLRVKSIQVDCMVDDDLIVNANQALVFSIFRNLMENSVNYGNENIRISIVNYLEDNSFYYFSYSDNGPGVSEEHLSRLFERFYRVDAGRSRKQGGTGLGLAIVKNAVISFKGEISARTRKGGGLEFLFSLPR